MPSEYQETGSEYEPDFVPVTLLEEPLEGQLMWVCQRCFVYSFRLKKMYGRACCPACVEDSAIQLAEVPSRG